MSVRSGVMGVLGVILLGGSVLAQSAGSDPVTVETKTGLKYQDLVEGHGAPVATGMEITCNYVGRLANGKVFDSSIDRGKPYVYIQGVTELIPGWVEGVSTMKEGGKRRLFIPSKLAYGAEGALNVIPPNTDLIFDIEVLKVEDPKASKGQ